MIVDVMPRNDLIDHTHGIECTCWPTLLHVNVDNTVSWIAVHHSLDGRERYETCN